MDILKILDFVIINGGEIHAVFHGISLVFPVVVQYDIAVCLVDGNGLKVTMSRSATISGSRLRRGGLPFIHCTGCRKKIEGGGKSRGGRDRAEGKKEQREGEEEEGCCETHGQACAETVSDQTVASEMDSKP